MLFHDLKRQVGVVDSVVNVVSVEESMLLGAEEKRWVG